MCPFFEDRSDTSFVTTLSKNAQCFRFLLGNNCPYTRPNNCRFFLRYTFERVAQILFMVQPDRCDAHETRICSGGGVEPAAHSCLENCEFDFRVAKGKERNHSHLLEKSRKCFDLLVTHQLLRHVTYDGCAGCKILGCDVGAGDADTFGD